MTEFEKYLKDELEKYSTQSFPLKAGILTRLFVKKADCSKLHPNPNDEFCFPEVGPSYRIIGEYEKKYRDAERHGQQFEEEPLIVEKMYPDGYMLINGHHRWAAALRMGKKSIPVKVVNLAHESDIDNMMKDSDNDRRVTFDLDEVIFVTDGPSEKTPGFPADLFYKERIKPGVPVLFNFLLQKGYDIWVYSEKYYSIDFIRALFKNYHVTVSGIVTGTAKKSNMDEDAKNRIQKQISEKYKYTIHVDNDTVLKTLSKSKDFEEFNIEKDAADWSREVKRIIGDMD